METSEANKTYCSNTGSTASMKVDYLEMDVSEEDEDDSTNSNNPANDDNNDGANFCANNDNKDDSHEEKSVFKEPGIPSVNLGVNKAESESDTSECLDSDNDEEALSDRDFNDAADGNDNGVNDSNLGDDESDNYDSDEDAAQYDVVQFILSPTKLEDQFDEQFHSPLASNQLLVTPVEDSKRG